jgi:site-specific DNA-methyltransferase (adenine-specific)
MRVTPKSIHAVVTDPPFGILEYLPDQLKKRRNGNGGIWRIPRVLDGQVRSATPRFTVLRDRDHKRIREFHERLAPLLFKVLVPGGHVLLASQNLLSYYITSAFADAGFELRGQIARVVKTLRGGDRPKGAHREFSGVSVSPRTSWEPWLLFRRPCEGTVSNNLRKWRTGGLRRPAANAPFRDLIQSSPARGEERRIAPHPSLKPQQFMRQVVAAVLPVGKGVILDPFMGAGSTIAAAARLGFRSIGLEINREYFELARNAVPRLAEVESANGRAVRRVVARKNEVWRA